jgi:hypothetical protein
MDFKIKLTVERQEESNNLYISKSLDHQAEMLSRIDLVHSNNLSAHN